MLALYFSYSKKKIFSVAVKDLTQVAIFKSWDLTWNTKSSVDLRLDLKMTLADMHLAKTY